MYISCMAFAPTGSRYRSIGGRWAAGGTHRVASLTTSLTGTNNDLVFTTKKKGAAGNDIRVVYVVAGNDTAFRVDYSANVLTVTAATDGAGVATTRASDVTTAVNSRSDIPVAVTNAGSDDGTGVIVAMAARSLSGGTDWLIGTGRR